MTEDIQGYQVVAFSGSFCAHCDIRDPIVWPIGAAVFYSCYEGELGESSSTMDELRLSEEAAAGAITILRRPVDVPRLPSNSRFPVVLITSSRFLARVYALGDHVFEALLLSHEDGGTGEGSRPDGVYSDLSRVGETDSTDYRAIVMDRALTREWRERWAVLFLEEANTNILRAIEAEDLTESVKEALRQAEEDCEFGLESSLDPDLREGLCLRLAAVYTIASRGVKHATDCERLFQFYESRVKYELELEFDELCALVEHLARVLRTASVIRDSHAISESPSETSASIADSVQSYLDKVRRTFPSQSRVGRPLAGFVDVLTEASEELPPIQIYANFARDLQRLQAMKQKDRANAAERLAREHKRSLRRYNMTMESVTRAFERLGQHYAAVFRPCHHDAYLLAVLSEPIAYVMPDAWRMLPDGSVIMLVYDVLSEDHGVPLPDILQPEVDSHVL